MFGSVEQSSFDTYRHFKKKANIQELNESKAMVETPTEEIRDPTTIAKILESAILNKLISLQQSTGMHVPISKVNALKTMENNMSVHHDMSIGQIRQNIIDNVNTLQKVKARRRYRDASVNFQEFSSQTDARHLSSVVLDPQQSQRTFSIDQTREIF